jgi:hypothetical protein
MRPTSLHSARLPFATIERFRRMSVVLTGVTDLQNHESCVRNLNSRTSDPPQ